MYYKIEFSRRSLRLHPLQTQLSTLNLEVKTYQLMDQNHLCKAEPPLQICISLIHKYQLKNLKIAIKIKALFKHQHLNWKQM